MSALPLLLLSLLLQAAMLGGLMLLWRRQAGLGPLESLVAALVSGHLLQILLMAALSAGHGLTPLSYRLVFGSSGLALLGWGLRHSGAPVLRPLLGRLRGPTGLPLGLTLVAAGGLLLALFRASFFFDTTYDSLTYGLPRLAFYVQERSIFFLSGLADVRIDANERNGELAFLHQLLLAGDTRWLALGGVTAWLTTLAAVLFLLRTLEVEPALTWAAGGLMALSPLVFGLSAVTKGDIFAAAYLMAAVSWLLRAWRRDPTQEQIWLFLTALCLAVTCKLTAVFAAASVGGFYGWDFLRRRHPWRLATLLSVAAAAALAFSKAIQNTLVYHHPFQRNQLEADASHFSLAKLRDGLADFPRWFLGLQPDSLPWGHHNDLEKSLGAVALALALLVLLASLSPTRHAPARRDVAPVSTLPLRALSAALVVSALIVLAIVPVRDSGFNGNAFRYLLPYVLPGVAIVFAGALRRSAPRRATLFTLGLFSCYHLACATNPSETFSHRGRRDAMRRVAHYDRLVARQGYWDEELPAPTRARLAGLQREPHRVWLVQERADVPLFECFGDNLDWHVTRVAQPGQLPAAALAPDTDLVSVVTGERREPTPELHATLVRLGWSPDLRTRFYTLYARGPLAAAHPAKTFPSP